MTILSFGLTTKTPNTVKIPTNTKATKAINLVMIINAIGTKIKAAAKAEFLANPLRKARVSNIVAEARIPRGSFYQYKN